MNESNEKQAGFFGTYFERDSVLRLAHGADTLSWVTLTIYGLTWLVSMLTFIAQFFSGIFFDKGGTFLMTLNIFVPYLLQPLPGVFYFFGLQAVSKVLLILLDMEDNTRRAARK